MRNVLYIDVETTGLDPIRNDMVRLAMIIEQDGIIKEELIYSIQPLSYEHIDLGALAINGLTVDMIKKFDDPLKVYYQIKKLFAKYVDKYTKETRFIPAGYCTQFDLNFLAKFFKQADPEDPDTKFGLGSWIQWNLMFDMLAYLRNASWIKGSSDYPNFKLETVAKAHGIVEHLAHDALSDVRVTRQLIKLLV